MQQVGAKDFVGARPVDPRQLPALLNPASRRARIALSHVWVLHRKAVLRGMAAVLAAATLFGVYEAREPITAAGITVFRFVQGEFAQAGFGIESIRITGQTLTDDADIITLLTVGTGNSTLTFDAQQAQARLKWLRAVKSATVRKVYPNQILVDIVEKVPVIRWRLAETTWLVDDQGDKIGTDVADYTELPLAIGEGASEHGVAMARSLARHPKLMDGLAAMSRIGNRRWDLIYRNGLRIQLPEVGVGPALDRLDMYQRDYSLLARDVVEIDLRVPGVVTLKPGELAAAQIAEARKPKKKP